MTPFTTWVRALKNRLIPAPPVPHPPRHTGRALPINHAVRQALAVMLAGTEAVERGEIGASDVHVRRSQVDGRWHAYVRLADGTRRHRAMPRLPMPGNQSESETVPADMADMWLKLTADVRHRDKARTHRLRRSTPGGQG